MSNLPWLVSDLVLGGFGVFFVFQFLFCFVFLCLFFPFYLEGMGGSGNREVGGGFCLFF